MSKKIIVWFIGSNGTGKTTQSKMLCDFFKRDELKIIEGPNFLYSSFGKIANIGKVQDNQCCGTDILETKEKIKLSYLEAIKNHNIVTFDGIMATGTWIEFMREVPVKIILVYLKTDILSNLSSIRNRRQEKNNVKNISKNTIENLKGKINGFESLYNKLENKVDSALKFNAKTDKKIIHNKILKEIKLMSSGK